MVKKLYRRRRDRRLGGVCAGIADYFNLDVTLVRLIFVCSLYLGGMGFTVYVLGWIIIPEEPRDDAYVYDPKDDDDGHVIIMNDDD